MKDECRTHYPRSRRSSIDISFNIKHEHDTQDESENRRGNDHDNNNPENSYNNVRDN